MNIIGSQIHDLESKTHCLGTLPTKVHCHVFSPHIPSTQGLWEYLSSYTFQHIPMSSCRTDIPIDQTFQGIYFLLGTA